MDGDGLSPTISPSLLLIDIANDSELTALLSIPQPTQATNTSVLASAEGSLTAAELDRRQPHVDEQDGLEGLELTTPGQGRTQQIQSETSR